jgi:WD40 repeat protein
MTIKAWIFLVSSNKKFDYRTVACPDFICKKGASELISKIKYRDLNEQGDLNCCEIDDKDFKLTLIYRCKKLTKEDLLPEINETPTERGRPILLTEGIIIEGMRATEIKDNKIIFSRKEFDEVHKKILEYYRKFWVNVYGDDLPYETKEIVLNQNDSSQEFMNIVLDPSSKKEDEHNVDNNSLLTKKKNNEQLINTANFKSKNINIKIRSFAFDTNRDYCAFVYENKSIGLYKVDSLNFDLPKIRDFDLQESSINPIENLINNLSEPKKSNISIAFSHNGEIIASAGNFKSKEQLEVKLWELKIESQKVIASIEIKANKDDCILIACSPNENVIAINNPNNIILYNSIGTRGKTPLAGYKDSIKSIDISKASPPLIIMGDKDGTIKLWNLETKKLIKSITTAHLSSINSVVFSPDGSIISSGSEDKDIKFWDSKTGNLISSISTESAVNSVAFNAEGTLLVSGHDDQTIKLWDVKNKKPIDTLYKHKAAVTSVGFSRDSSILISVSKDLQAIIWSVSG